MSDMELMDLADKIARDIFSEGGGPTPCQRIQFLGGSYPDGEIDQGGLCEVSLARVIRKTLHQWNNPFMLLELLKQVHGLLHAELDRNENLRRHRELAGAPTDGDVPRPGTAKPTVSEATSEKSGDGE